MSSKQTSKLEVLSEDDNSNSSSQSDSKSQDEPASPQNKKSIKEKRKPPPIDTKTAPELDGTPTPDTAKVQPKKSLKTSEPSSPKKTPQGKQKGDSTPLKLKVDTVEGRKLTKALERQRQWAEQKLKAGDKFGLAVEYPTFELLWYDIEWRTREIINDLVQPVKHDLIQNEDSINQLFQEKEKVNGRIDELKETIFNTSGKLDVFEQINLKIANGAAETKILGDKVQHVESKVFERMGTINEEHAIQTAVFKNLQVYTHEVMDEVSKLKDTYKYQCDRFIEELRVLNKQLNDDVENLTQRCQKLDNITDDHNQRLLRDNCRIDECLARINLLEKNVIDLQKETSRLEYDKTDLKLFNKVHKQIQIKNLEQDIKLYKNTNHCITLDNYLDKYQPIRTQALINETLRSVVNIKERRRLELYDNEKNALLYQNMLDDAGTGEIAKLMRLLHARAATEIEESELRRKKHQAIIEAAQGRAIIGGKSPRSPTEMSPQSSRSRDSPLKIQTTQIDTRMQSSRPPETKHSTEALGTRPTAPEQVYTPAVVNPDSSRFNLQLPENELESEKSSVNPTMDNLPTIVANDTVYNLYELVNSDFIMKTSDIDFEMTPEQLIKATKILLYKFNLQVMKSNIERQRITELLNERMTGIEVRTKQSVAEVNTFLHQLSYDVEQYIDKQKRENVGLNEKVLKVCEDLNSLATNTVKMGSSIEQYATVLTCMVEFNSIEQALATQDEQDKSQMNLLGGSNTLKIKENEFDQGYRRTARNSSILSNGRNLSKLSDHIGSGVIKGMNATKRSNDGKMLTFMNHNVNQDMHSELDIQMMREAEQLQSIIDSKIVDEPVTFKTRSGSTKVDKSCLSCTGVTAHTMKMFKLACLSYKPNPVHYRQKNLSRNKLLVMRKTLVDKCEEIINGEQWPGRSDNIDTARIFKDLMNFYGTGDLSSANLTGIPDVYNTMTTLPVTSPQHKTQFMPQQVSNKTMKHLSNLDDNSTDYQSANAFANSQKGIMNRKRSHQMHHIAGLSPQVGLKGSGLSLQIPGNFGAFPNTKDNSGARILDNSNTQANLRTTQENDSIAAESHAQIETLAPALGRGTSETVSRTEVRRQMNVTTNAVKLPDL